MMTRDELIIHQQIQIEELLESVKQYEDDHECIRQILVGVGGPLNDNILDFNVNQRNLLHRILRLVEIPYTND